MSCARADVVAFGPEASGTAEAPKVFKEIGGRREFTGATALPRDGWKAVPGKSAVRVFDLRTVGIDKLTKLKDDFMVWDAELLMKRGRPQPLARDPSTGWNRMAGVIDYGTRPLDPKIEEFHHGVRPGAFVYRTDEKKIDPASWDVAKGVWLYGYWGNDWYAQYLKVGSVDPATNGIRLAAISLYGIGVQTDWEDPARRWCAFNALAFVDAPGEWYVDREEAKVYYIDPDGDYEGLALATEKRPLLTLRGVKHARFRDLVFRETAGCGVVAEGCEDVRFENCRVFSTGGTAMSLRDVKDTWVVRCVVHGSGSSGLSISGGDRQKLISSGNRVVACDLGHTGRLSKTFGGQALIVSGVGTVVEGCYIHDTPYIAFSYAGNDHLIVSNEVAFAMLESGDGGALYTGRDWGSQGNVIRNNYIHHLGLAGYDYKVAHGETPEGEPLKVRVQTMGAYLDDCDSGDTVVSNVFYRAGWAVFVGGGRDNKIRDNVMVSCTSASHIDLRGLQRMRLDDTGDESWRLNRKLEKLHYRESPWKDRYPWLVSVMENDPKLPIGTEWTGNLSVNCGCFLDGYRRPEVKKVVDERLVMRDNRIVTTNEVAATEMLRAALKEKCRTPEGAFPSARSGRILGRYTSVCPSAKADASAWADELDASFALKSEDARIAPRDLGLVNGHVTFNGWVEDLGSVRQLYAPPYHCGNFRLDVTFGGAAVKPTRWTWRPECVVREGTAGVWRVTTRLYPLANARGGILAIEAENGGGTPAALNVDCRVCGTPGYRRKWVFDAPSGADGSFPNWRGEVRGYVLDSEGRPARVTFGTSSGSGTWEHSAKMSLSAAAGGTAPTAYAVFSLAGPDEADATVRQALADPAGAVRAARAAWRERVAELAARVPRFSSDNEALVRLYRRSLIHFPLTRWDVDEFVLKPFYVTGGLFGSCMCSYLWNLGGPYRMWAMVDPAVIREQLKAYLRLDLTRCYALNPCDGGPVGPYYPVNQEKMIFMIRAYVLGTGDVGFLRETVGGKSIVEHVVGMALFHDDLTKEAVLADYGKANDHLELRRGFPYNGEMPDLNLRRIVLLRLADKLCRLAGHDPKVDLVRRADALKALCRREQWDAKQRWFVGRCANGKRTTRWTIQMFKALGWGDWVLDADVRDGLIGHLMDESEFLGSHGVHSLSKKDEAWDDWDVDNGGPGACVSFAPAIAERLYADGRAREAETILRRLTWLADGYPYWCDSHYADRADYRHNTPLQLNVEGGVIAQAIIFGLFGISVDDDFSVRATPHLPADTDMIALEGVKLAGKTFSVRCSRKEGTKVLGSVQSCQQGLSQ